MKSWTSCLRDRRKEGLMHILPFPAAGIMTRTDVFMTEKDVAFLVISEPNAVEIYVGEGDRFFCVGHK